MAANDLQVIKSPGAVRSYQTDDRTTSGMVATCKPGEPIKVGGTDSNYVDLLLSGSPLIGTDEFIGVCRKESTETTSANGTVEVITAIPVLTVIRGKAMTSANMTASNLITYLGDWVTFEWNTHISDSVYINEDEGSDPNVHGLKIIAGDVDDNHLDVVVNAMCCEACAYR